MKIMVTNLDVISDLERMQEMTRSGVTSKFSNATVNSMQ